MSKEFTPQQIAEMQGAHALLQKLMGNKETKRDIERLAKKVNPDAITTDDLAEPYVAEVKEELKLLREWKNGMETQIKDYNQNQKFDALRASGYTSEGIDAIKKIMEEQTISNPDVAAAYFDKTRPQVPMAPNGLTPSRWNFGDVGGDSKEDQDLLFRDDDAWLDKTAALASREWGAMNTKRDQ